MELLLFAITLLTAAYLSVADQYVAPILPSVYRMKEVKFTDGDAGATNYYSPGTMPLKAFIPRSPIDSNMWHTGSGSSSGSPPDLPVMIWYDFKSRSIRPEAVSFQSAQAAANLQRGPTSYQFVGSNDAVCNDDSTWTVLCEDLSDRAWRNRWDVKRCKVKPEITEEFRCLGLVVLSSRGDGWVTLRNIRMWERIEARAKITYNP